MLLQYAYQPQNGFLAPSQIVGGPSWIETERYDIQAKPPDESHPIPEREMAAMVQSLLEDRFQLKAHFETRQMPVYRLVVVKKGKMKASDAPGAIPIDKTTDRETPSSRTRMTPTPDGYLLQADGVSLQGLTNTLQTQLGRPVIDKTNLEGLFDVELHFSLQVTAVAGAQGGATAPHALAPSLFTAVQEQLGLKLESAREPGDVLVIERIQRPTQN